MGDEVEEDWQGFRYEDGSPVAGPVEIVQPAKQPQAEPDDPPVWLDPFGREVPQWQPTCLDEAGVQVWPVQAQAAEALVETVDGYRLEQAFLADEVKALADQLGIDFGGYRRDAAGDPDSLIYEQFIPPLVSRYRDLGSGSRRWRAGRRPAGRGEEAAGDGEEAAEAATRVIEDRHSSAYRRALGRIVDDAEVPFARRRDAAWLLGQLALIRAKARAALLGREPPPPPPLPGEVDLFADPR